MAAPPFPPANLSIFKDEDSKFKYIGQVKVLDIFTNNTRDFHPEGLFSTEIFGRVGSEERLKRFSYIDVRVPILHPRVFSHICSLKQVYKEIMAGKQYAKWDPKERDFIKTEPGIGNTGYHFFISHFKEINFRQTVSKRRDAKIEIVRKFKDNSLTRHVLVIPAGLRDLEVKDDGTVEDNEINDFYRTLIRISNTLSTIHDLDSPIIDKARFSLQIAFNELHNYLMTNIAKGKNSFFNAKFGRRKIKYGTRNVFSVASTSVRHLDDPTNVMPYHTQVGLFQSVKASEPLFYHYLKKEYIDKVFGDNSGWLIDPKTLQRVEIPLKAKTIDRWCSTEGVVKIINQFIDSGMRNEYVMVEKHYLGLIYKKDGQYKLIFNMDDIPEDNIDAKDHVYPITWGEMFYILANRYMASCPADITRYPIAGADSIYPSYNYIRTTGHPLRMVELDDQWQPTDRIYAQFPNTENNQWFDTMAPSILYLGGLGGDYDGDTGNNNVNMSEEAKEQTAKYLNSMQAHIDVNGRMIGSPLVDNVKRIIFNMTGD